MPNDLFELDDKRLKPMALSEQIIANPHWTKTELKLN
jgi:hypothetical protein